MKLLEIKNVKKSFGAVDVLHDISLSVEQGEVVAIIGPSGSGKSTLLNIIGGIDSADSGYISINGEKTADMNEKALTNYRRRHLGYVFQMYNLIPNLNVKENIEVGAYLSDKSLDIGELLKTLGLYEHRHKLPNQLSGGQQQRVAIARALVNEPKVLLLDEPLGALDAKIRKQMQVELKKIQQEVGITFIYVTHDQEEALSMSDTVVVMNNGEIQQIGSPTDIYNEPENRFVAGFIGESNIIEGTMIRDYLVAFDGFEFECVDKGFEDNEEIEVVLRPEDLDIVDPGQAKIRGIVRNITFKGVHYEILIETELRTYMVHTTDYAEVGREVGLKFGPEDIHVMCKMGSY